MLRVWNLSLLCATFSLTILGTFLTRSGVLDSVHAFTESRASARASSRSSRSSCSVRSGSSAGAAIGCARPARSTRPSRVRARSSPTTCCSPRSRSSCCSAPCSRSCVEAVNGERISVGRAVLRPDDDADRHRAAVPHGGRAGAAVAQGVGRAAAHRLLWPAWIGTGVVVLAVAFGARGLAPLVAFGLGGFAAGAAMRQIVLATRRQGWRGLVGRANGGMIVHLGVVVIAVAFAASSSYSHSAEFLLKPGRVGIARRPHHHLPRHRTCDRGAEVDRPSKGAGRRRPGLRACPLEVPGRDEHDRHAVGAHRVARRRVPHAARRAHRRHGRGSAAGCSIMPLVVWLWIGGGLMAVGTVLAAWPGRRRRPTDPVSAPIPERHVRTPPPEEPVGEPVGAGVDG